MAVCQCMAVCPFEHRGGRLCVVSISLEPNHPLSCAPQRIDRLYFDENYFFMTNIVVVSHFIIKTKGDQFHFVKHITADYTAVGRTNIGAFFILLSCNTILHKMCKIPSVQNC